ncbi:UNVERIFIED_CONTAM: hypothetical protein Sradi_6286800 [Sesamum radiatum]|uniref:Uncharacterized protein n=1 Tax=Sesamum radiatum TaxID=300843 RepID=A0AAW2KBH5_SESRA
MPSLETVNGAAENFVENDDVPEHNEDNEGLSGSDLADQNPIRTICVFEPTDTVERENALINQGATRSQTRRNNDRENDEREHEGSSWNLPANEASLDLAADDDDFIEAKARGRHRRGRSTGRQVRIMTRSHARARSISSQPPQ